MLGAITFRRFEEPSRNASVEPHSIAAAKIKSKTATYRICTKTKAYMSNPAALKVVSSQLVWKGSPDKLGIRTPR
jgi:hypothetical protein